MSASLEEIQRQIKALQAEINADVKRVINPKHKQLDGLQSQLRAANMEAYFNLFPEKRIAVDDKILVTDEFNHLMQKRGTWGSPANTEGVIFWIYDTESILVKTKEGPVSIPLDLAIRMRQAWLDKESSK
jgi:hypothetical protein